MHISEIKKGLADKTLVKSGNKIYTASEWDQIEKAKASEDFFDLKQLIKKLLL